MKQLGLGSVPPLDAEVDYRHPLAGEAAVNAVNLNGVTRGPNGLLLCFGRVMGRRRRLFRPDRPASFAVVELASDRRPLGSVEGTLRLHRGDHLVGAPNHNVAEDGDLLVYNDSNRNCLVAFDAARDAELRAVQIPGDPPFARGLTRVGRGLWLVGSQEPAAVHAVDLEHGGVVGTFSLQAIPDETVYAISPLPDRFDDPPALAAQDPRAFWVVQPA
jgi:hypothetical protein